MKSLLIANWKMNPPTFAEAKKLLEATKKAADSAKNVTFIVTPPAIFLRQLRGGYRGKRIAFGVQNAHPEPKGSFTGEISLLQAKDAGATYVIIGHAERRAMGETNEETRVKVSAAVALGMYPILCVGETARTHEGDYFAFIKEELRAGFAEVAVAKVSRVTVAYEPIWAIGAATAMDPRDMHEMAIFIRKSLVELYGEKAMAVRILYGGAIGAENAVAMLTHGDIAGLLVGRASADPVKLTELARSIKQL